MLKAPRVVLEGHDSSTVQKVFEGLTPYKIAENNWANDFPYSPTVEFKIAHDGMNIFLEFSVNEKEVFALAQGNNSQVWTDSCVEFFISFNDSEFYYNLEFSCIGQKLLGYRKERNSAIHAEDRIIDSIQTTSTLGNKNFGLKKGNFEWTLQSIIPITTFWKSNIQSLDGLKAKANFYKCGDNLTTPHYLSWMPIATNTPNFHQPVFFQQILFES